MNGLNIIHTNFFGILKFMDDPFFFQVILVLGDEKDPNKGIKGVIDIDDDDDDDFGSMMFKGSSSSTGM